MSKTAQRGAIIGLVVILGSSLSAQQSGSALQVVTFGVVRTPQMLINSVAAISSSGPELQSSNSKAFQHQLSVVPEKITFSASSPTARATYGRQAFETDGFTNGSSLLFEQWSRWNGPQIQKDLRSFLLENKFSHLAQGPLVLTITD